MSFLVFQSVFCLQLYTFSHPVLVTFPHHMSILSHATTFNDVIGSTSTNFLNFSLLLLSFMETPHIHLIICISARSNFHPTSDMIDELGWPPLSQKRQAARLILFYTIINGLGQLLFECVLIESYKGTRRNTIQNSDRLVIQQTSMDNCFSLKLLVHGTSLLSLKLCSWLYLGLIFFKISVHPFRIIP